MSNYTTTRDYLVQMVVNDLGPQIPGVPIFWENTLSVDLDVVSSPFMRVEIEFDDSSQMTVTGAPKRALHGAVSFTVLVKAGDGTRKVLEIFDTIESVVKFRTSTNCNLGLPLPGAREERKGWVSYEIRAPFTAHDVS